MYHEHKTLKCPICGDPAELSSWKPPRGIDPRLRQYICSDPHCRFVFHTCGIFHIQNKKP